MTPRHGIFVTVLFSALLAACGGGDSGGGPPKSKAFPVEVETVVGREVKYEVSAVGSVEAFEEVQITARVQGVVEKVNFKEGQAVTPETVLVEIEPARFQYTYDAAKAAHERAQAELKEAQDGLKRRENPERPGLFAKEEVEAWRTKVAVASALERERAAVLSQAQLDLQNATPKPPMSGVVQSRLVSTGQWVTPGTVIARLLRRDPMLLRFSVPEDEASDVAPGMECSFTLGDEVQHTAVLTHVGASADVSTRMVQVIAEVKPGNTQLTPGSFMRVSIPIPGRSSGNAPTVPESAIRPSQDGFLVYVVKDGKAYQRKIKTGLHTPEQQEGDRKVVRVQVTSGLALGEVVVTRGAEALRDGVEVAVAGPGKPGGKPAGAAP